MTTFLGLDSESRVARFLMTDPKNSFKKSHQVSAFVESDSHLELLRSMASGSTVRMKPKNSEPGSPCGITIAELASL